MKFCELNEKELMCVSGGEIDFKFEIDGNMLYKVLYDFGHDVVYKYVWSPLKGWVLSW